MSGATQEAAAAALSRYGVVVPVESSNGKQYIQVQADEVAAITARMLSDLPIQDLTIEDPPVEDVIERAFQA